MNARRSAYQRVHDNAQITSIRITAFAHKVIVVCLFIRPFIVGYRAGIFRTRGQFMHGNMQANSNMVSSHFMQ